MSLQQVLGIFSYSFVQNALIVGLVIAFCAALLGVILVLKRYSLIGYGLSNVGFAAISLALAFEMSTLYVSIPIVIIASFLIMWISQKNNASGDVAIGIVAATSLSFGVTVTALNGGFNVDVSNYMFGSILAVTQQDVILCMILGFVVILLFALFYNRLLLVTYDENYAKACGINVTFYQFLISFLAALTVVIGMRMVGTLLISSLIIFPAVIVKNLVKSFKALIIVSGIVSVICLVIGIIASFIFNLPAGAGIVLVNVAVLLISTVITKIIKR